MLNYFLYLDEFIEVDEKFFYNLIDVYSTKFLIWKFDNNCAPYCESEMIPDKTLFYWIRNNETNKFHLIGEIHKTK